MEEKIQAEPGGAGKSLARALAELCFLGGCLVVYGLLVRWGEFSRLFLTNALFIAVSVAWMALGMSPGVGVSKGRHIRTMAACMGLLCLCVMLFCVFWPRRLLRPEWDGFLEPLLLILVVPAAEEMFFRGILLDSLRRIAGRVAATVVVSLLFGFLHAGQGAFFPMVILSAGGCALALASGNVVWAIGLHTAWNACAVMNVTHPPVRTFVALCAAGAIVAMTAWTADAGRGRSRALP